MVDPRVHVVFGLWCIQCRHGPLEAVQTLHHGSPLDQLAVGIGEPAEAVLHAREGGARLHHLAEGDLPAQIQRQRSKDGNEQADAHIGGREGGELELAVDQRAPVVPDGGITHLEPTVFRALAPVEGDLLGMVTDAQQRGTIVRLTVLALHVQPLQTMADPVCQPRAQHRIGQCHPHQIAVHHHGDAAHADRVHARGHPQDGHEGAQLGHVVDEREEQREALVGQQPDVLGNPLVGVVRLVAQLQPVLTVPSQPAALQTGREMRAPAEHQHLLQPLPAGNAEGDQRHVDGVFDDQ